MNTKPTSKEQRYRRITKKKVTSSNNDSMRFDQNDQIHLPQIQKQLSVEQSPDNIDDIAAEIMRVPSNVNKYRVSRNSPQKASDYPNLKLMFDMTNDQTQKKSLLQIMKKNPLLAASLNLYACSQEQIQKIKKPKKIDPEKSSKVQLQPLQGQEKIEQQESSKRKSKSKERKQKPHSSENEFTHKFRASGNQQPPRYYFLLGKGNNDALIRQVMRYRQNWIEVPITTQSHIHFRWQQSYFGYAFDKMTPESFAKREIYNHFEFHKELTTKTGLTKNLKSYCSIIPPVFMVNLEDQHRRNELDQFIVFYTQNMPESFKGRYDGPYRIQLDNKKPGYQVSPNKMDLDPINLENNTKLNDVFISDETYLWLLKPSDMNRGNGVHVFSCLKQLEILLKSYYSGCYKCDLEKLTEQIDLTEQEERKEQINNENKQGQIMEYEQQNNIKRQDNDCEQNDNKNDDIQQEQNICQIDNLQIEQVNTDKFKLKKINDQQCTQIDNFQNDDIDSQVEEIKKQKQDEEKEKTKKYIEKPLLIEQRKFDLRLWVLLTHQQQYYLFKEGYLRTSSENFSLRDDNLFIHLTNNAIQKNSKNYSKFEGGNQLSYFDFQFYLNKHFPGVDFKLQIIPKIKDIIKLSLSCVKHKINEKSRKFCFEIFGYDFMIDQNFKPWLIEVNTNPCIEESSGILKMYLPRMIDDAFRMTVDQVFSNDPKVVFKKVDSLLSETNNFMQMKQPSPFTVNDYSDTENMWEFLGQFYQ